MHVLLRHVCICVVGFVLLATLCVCDVCGVCAVFNVVTSVSTGVCVYVCICSSLSYHCLLIVHMYFLCCDGGARVFVVLLCIVLCCMCVYFCVYVCVYDLCVFYFFVSVCVHVCVCGYKNVSVCMLFRMVMMSV